MVFKPQTFHEEPPQAEIDNPTQAELEARVAAALARVGSADAGQVGITVESGVVILTGQVGRAAEIVTVGEAAGRVDGVVAVENRVAAVGSLG